VSRVATQLEELRDNIGEIDALAALALDAFDYADWGGADPQLVERVAYVIGIIARTAATAGSKLDAFHAAVADTQPVPAGQVWDYEKGTASAPGEADAPDRDADIVQRIRERYPDSRYAAASDAELLELFKRNKRVLSRGDEDVIAAMTRPR
jgi:hypothetical protein